jgi:hypothetical protein
MGDFQVEEEGGADSAKVRDCGAIKMGFHTAYKCIIE